MRRNDRCGVTTTEQLDRVEAENEWASAADHAEWMSAYSAQRRYDEDRLLTIERGDDPDELPEPWRDGEPDDEDEDFDDEFDDEYDEDDDEDY